MLLISNPLFHSYMHCRESQVLRQISKKVPIELLFHDAYELTSRVYQEIIVNGENGWSYPWKIKIENKELGIKLVDRTFENYQQARSYIIECLENDSEIYIWVKNKWIPHMEFTNSDLEGEHSLTLTSYDEGKFKVVDYPFEQTYTEHIIQKGFDHISGDTKIVSRFTFEAGVHYQNAIDPIKQLFKESILSIRRDSSFYESVVRAYNELEFEIWLNRSVQAFGVISLSRLLTSMFLKYTSYSDRNVEQMLKISKSTENIKNYLMKSSFTPHKFDIADFQQRCTTIQGLEEDALRELQNELLTGIKRKRLQSELHPPTHCKVIHATDTSLWLEWEDKQREYEQIYYDIWLNNTLVDSTSSLQYTLGNLDPSKNYCVTVKARNHIGQISDGVKVEASTLDVITSGNLALHKPVKASSIENSDFDCIHVVDNDPNTRWSTDYQDEQWIYVDLGLSKTITQIRLHWEGAYPSKYRIEFSDNLEDWNLIYEEVSGEPGVFILEDLDLIGRYVRVTCISRATIFGYSLYELSVFNESK
ncbi:discoidin domain-containing protein [Paenibacillus motobuensis]|uniref:F5/8 type C domain-containing protein n=1 Tax=Paenibacillus motobuensis TaxID=295324 RepID=A0ABN0Y4K6_9BACL